MKNEIQQAELDLEIVNSKFEIICQQLKNKQQQSNNLSELLENKKQKLFKYQQKHQKDLEEANKEISQMQNLMNSQNQVINDFQYLSESINEKEELVNILDQQNQNIANSIVDINSKIDEVISDNQQLEIQISQFQEKEQIQAEFKRILDKNNVLKEKLIQGEKIIKQNQEQINSLQNRLQSIFTQFQKKTIVVQSQIQENKNIYKSYQLQNLTAQSLAAQVQNMEVYLDQQEQQLKSLRQKKKQKEESNFEFNKIIHKFYELVQVLNDTLQEVPKQQNEHQLEEITTFIQQQQWHLQQLLQNKSSKLSQTDIQSIKSVQSNEISNFCNSSDDFQQDQVQSISNVQLYNFFNQIQTFSLVYIFY